MNYLRHPGLFGTPGTYLGSPDLFGTSRSHLGPLEFIWDPLNLFGTPWTIWEPWDLFGTPWTILDPFWDPPDLFRNPPDLFGTHGSSLDPQIYLGPPDVGTPWTITIPLYIQFSWLTDRLTDRLIQWFYGLHIATNKVLVNNINRNDNKRIEIINKKIKKTVVFW